MLPTVRRVVASSTAVPPAAAVAAALVWSSSATHGQIQLTQPVRRNQQQQRRYSSSKPSSPDNGSKALPGVPSNSSSSTSSTSTSTTTTAASASTSASSKTASSSKSSSPKRKRKAKDTSSSSTSASSSNAAAPSGKTASGNSNSNAAASLPRASTIKQKLPSVPSTQHLPMESVALSAFFSQHRPISITHSLPKIITEDAFAAIFAPRTARGKTSDVIRTLSRAVGDLEGPLAALSVNDGNQTPQGKSRRQSKESAAHARQQLQLQLEEDAEASAAATEEDPLASKVAFKNADGTDSDYYFQVNSMPDAYLPFHPPPAPMPEMTDAQAAEAAEAEAESAAAMDAENAADGIEGIVNGNDMKVDLDVVFNPAEAATPGSSRIFKAVLTIEEKVDENGEVQLVAHTPQILDENAAASAEASETTEIPRSFFERMALRQMRFDDARQHQRMVRQLQRYQLPSALEKAPSMSAISVKRQRKLKMKKKKYKKLMKRTRTLRRKLDRT